MGVELGGLLGAAASLTTAFSEDKSFKNFLKNIDNFGIQVKNNFEVNFSGLEDVTFFVQDINFNGIRQNFTEVSFDGRKVDIPVNHEYEHSGNMTIIDDAQGYIYSAITNFLLSDSTSVMANSGYTMTIKILTGDKKYAGSLVTLRGVRLESVDGLGFGYSQNDIQTFSLAFKYIDFTHTPGALGKAAGIIGGVNSLLGGQY